MELRKHLVEDSLVDMNNRLNMAMFHDKMVTPNPKDLVNTMADNVGHITHVNIV